MPLRRVVFELGGEERAHGVTMMDLASIPVLFMAGVVFGNGAHRFIIYRCRRFEEDLSFAAGCVAFGLYLLACAGLYSARSPEAGAVWQQAQFASIGLLCPALLWFFLSYTRNPSRRVVWLFGLPAMGLGLVVGLWRSDWTISATRAAVKTVRVPWGEVVYREMMTGPLAYVLSAWCIAAIVYGWWALWCMSRSGGSPRRSHLLAAFVFFSLTVFSDSLVCHGLLLIPYTMEYGFFSLVLFMGFQSAGELARGAAAEEEVRRSEERYRAFIESNSAGIWRFEYDPPVPLRGEPRVLAERLLTEGSLAECNESFVRMLGSSGRDDVLGGSAANLFSSPDGSLTEEFVRLAESGFKLKDATIHHVRRDGAGCWFSCGIDAVIEGGVLKRLWGAQLDVTEARRVAGALAESEGRLRLIADFVGEIFWIFDLPTMRLSYVSPAFERVWGRSLEELEYSPEIIISSVHPDDRPHVVEAFSRAPRYPSESIKYRIVRPDGQVRHIWTQAFHIAATPELSTRVVGTTKDITDVIDAMARIREEETRSQCLIENTGTLMGIINEDMTMDVVNSAWVDFSGVPKDVIEKGMRIEQFMPVEEREIVRRNHRDRRLSPDTVPRAYELHMVRHDGESVPFLATVSLIPGTQQSVISLIDVSPLKQVQDDLRTSREMMRLILDHVPQRVFWKDANLVYQGCNRHFAADAGVENEGAIIGRTDYDVSPWRTDAENYRLCDRLVLETGAPLLRITEEFHAGDGKTFFREANKVPIRDAHGRITGVLGTYEDVTDRVQAESRLRESEEKFRSLFSSMSEGLAVHDVIFDEDGTPVDIRILDVNPAYTRHTGREREAVVGRRVTEVYGVSEIPHLAEITDVALTGRPADLEFYFEPLRRHFRVSLYSPQRGRFVAIVADVSEKVRLRELARETEERFRRVVEDTQEGIFIANASTLLLAYVNDALCRIVGRRAEEVVGQPCHTVLAPGEHPALCRHLDLVRAGVDTGPVTFAGQRRGVTFTAEAHLSCIRADGALCVLGVVRDITERREMEREFVASSEREQQRIGRELHDAIGQKLTGVKFLARGIARRAVEGDDAGLATVADQLEQISNNCIADARRIAAGLLPHTLQNDSIGDALHELAGNMRSMFDVECDYVGDANGVALPADASLHLYRIAQEAATNSVRHGRAARVVISLEAGARDRVLTVQDDGIGFDTGVVPLAGLGLRIMHHRASLLNGALDITSAPGRGTCVKCTIPCDRGEDGHES